MRRLSQIATLLLALVLLEVGVYILRMSKVHTCANKPVKERSTVNDDVIDDDPDIDLDMVDAGTQPLFAKDALVTNLDDQNRNETKHIAFLKVHKAASTTVQTILFRYGYTRGLDFVLPVEGNYFSKNTNQHEKLISPGHNSNYDILSLHCYFNYSVVSSIMPKSTVYIAIVREPLAQFISAVHYYRVVLKFSYLTEMTGDILHELINNPIAHETSVLTYTMNSMAKDFGFKRKHFYNYRNGSTNSSAHAYLSYLDQVFSFVMVAEWFDESLVLMKRLFNWSLKDILYMSKNVYHEDVELNIDKEDTKHFKTRNKLDYLIYEHFRRKFIKRLKAGGESLKDETNHFRKLLRIVQNWCEGDKIGEYTLHRSPWNEQFKIDATCCELMAKNEMPYIDFLRKHQLSTPSLSPLRL